jgi:hypothetical protein
MIDARCEESFVLLCYGLIRPETNEARIARAAESQATNQVAKKQMSTAPAKLEQQPTNGRLCPPAGHDGPLDGIRWLLRLD